jgi:hypothetical protein
VGRWLVASIFAVAVVSFVGAFGQQVQMKFPAWQFERARLVSQLKADGRRHLVIVRYGAKHHPNHEWVYNEADIDGARVVWAREMDPPQTHRLLQYFQDRQAWLAEIDIDDIPQTLLPYPKSP